MKRLILNIYGFYRDGFRNMTVGRTLWIMIAVKLAIIFLVVKYFFPDVLATGYDNDRDRAQAVRTLLK